MKKHLHVVIGIIFILCTALILTCVIFVAQGPTLRIETNGTESYQDDAEEIVISEDGMIESGSFNTMTKEEYLTNKASTLGILSSEAEADLDSNIQNAFETMKKSEQSDGDTLCEGNDDSTYTLYGTVSHIYVSDSGKRAKYDADAVLLQSDYGPTWVECIECGDCQPYGDGDYTFSGNTTAKLMSPLKLYLACSGYFEVAKPECIGLKIDFGLFHTSYMPGHTMYYRDSIYDTHVVSLEQSH